MSTANPTGLNVGASGLLNGRRYTVRGRVVLSMVAEDGERYFWHEFDVVDDTGATATLVYEEEEDGPAWKWFTLLEPRRPLTAAEAAAKRVGDTIEFEGRQIPITLVDESRVERIDGAAPEGVEVGDVAHYFNADAGQERMYVASWTGDEIEFYLGRALGRRQVEAAFKLPSPRSSSVAYAAGGGGGFTWDAGTIKAILWVIGIGLYVMTQLGSCYQRGGTTAAAPQWREAPALRLPAGASGRFGEQVFTVSAQATTEVQMPGTRFRQNEYWLRAPAGGELLILSGWAGVADTWIVLRPTEVPLTPVQAGALRRDGVVTVGGKRFTVQQLHLTRAPRIEGETVGAPWLAAESYGFMARAGDDWLLCRWSERGLRAWVGQRFAPATVVERFTKK
jgi:hypothetical protein